MGFTVNRACTEAYVVASPLVHLPGVPEPNEQPRLPRAAVTDGRSWRGGGPASGGGGIARHTSRPCPRQKGEGRGEAGCRGSSVYINDGSWTIGSQKIITGLQSSLGLSNCSSWPSLTGSMAFWDSSYQIIFFGSCPGLPFQRRCCMPMSVPIKSRLMFPVQTTWLSPWP